MPLESFPVTPDLPKTSWKHARPFRLGDLEVMPSSGELRGRRGVQRVRPLLMDILLRLAAEPGEVVRRETLLEDVWPRRMVNDEVLSRAIAELRTALGDEARDARYIETLPKIGYRLLAPVSEIAPEPAVEVPAPPAPARASARRRVLHAVLASTVGLALVAAVSLALRDRPVATDDIERALPGARPLSSDPGLEVGPRFSPDGRRVAFALVQGDDYRIVVQTVADSTRQTISGAGVGRFAPVFFPDGQRIAYWRREGAACAIVERELASGRERVLLDCELKPRPRFDLSPDGRWLAFSAAPRPQFPAGLYVLEIGGGAPRPLTTPEPGMGDDVHPRFSPDGKRIAFFRGGESNRAAWTVSRDDPASARVASKVEGLTYGAAWLGKEGPLLVAADWLGFRALHALDLASGEVKLLGARGARFPDVGPNREVVYENALYTANLFRAPLGGEPSPEPLWPSTRYTNQPEFSPDGRRVAFASNRDGTDSIYVAAPGEEPRRLAGSPEHRYMRPHWSPDGRFVYAVRTGVQGKGTAPQEAVRIPVDGGAAELLASLGSAVNDVRETHDGRALVWAELSGHAMRLMRAPVEAPARAERLPWPLVSQFDVHGDRLVFAQPHLATLTSCRLSNLACEPVALELQPQDLYHWRLGPRSLFMRAREASGGGVLRYDFASRAQSPAATVTPTGAGTSIAVSPDESVLLVVREEGPAIDLMIAK
jgi:DNA-binding winged helix-turn-helix (wHTH) protein/Tol biopolymer transport system component